MGLSHVAFTWACLGCFGGTMLSAVVPWVSAELLMLSLPALTPSPYELGALVVIGTVGQMLGKCFLYWTARRAMARKDVASGLAPSPATAVGAVPPRASAFFQHFGRVRVRLVRWCGRLMDRPGHATGVVLLSSSLGLPPFFVITMLAGAMKMNFATFLAVATAGRLVHFSFLVWAGTGWRV